ncbi:MAG: hypothetical protein K9J27_12565 [Bacteroidales bacterium]|nr:hypothetical protein [Bacteroidales bacterium]
MRIDLNVRLLIGILLVFSFPPVLYAQESGEKSNMRKAEQYLASHFDSLSSAGSDYKREAINRKIKDKFRSLLDHEASFVYPFDSLSNAGILKSPDEKVKIYNWNVPYEAGYHVFHCFIQYRKADSLMSFELEDASGKIDEPETKILDKDHWYAALYYDIIPKEGRRGKTYYTLLGYDPNDYMTNRKVIDVLYFDENNQPVFGAEIFKNQRNMSRRIVFEYAEFATMTLQYDEDKDMIVYDHLSPSKPRYEGQYEFYGPDFSYDGLRFEDGIWNTYFDLDIRLNEINLNE